MIEREPTPPTWPVTAASTIATLAFVLALPALIGPLGIAAGLLYGPLICAGLSKRTAALQAALGGVVACIVLLAAWLLFRAGAVGAAIGNATTAMEGANATRSLLIRATFGVLGISIVAFPWCLIGAVAGDHLGARRRARPI
jgi:hypothetical protein